MEVRRLAECIDWSQPWLAPLRPLRSCLEVDDWRAALSAEARRRGVGNAQGLPIVFALADDAPAGLAYEAHIAATGRVPTRGPEEGGLHDIFNALIWLTYPRTKAALNARQAAEIARDGIGARRGPVRDAATLIDENAVLIVCKDAQVFTALQSHDWQAALVAARARWGCEIHACTFGHALLEKLCAPYKAITAFVLPLTLQTAAPEELDAAAADFVARADLAPQLLSPLPVLGIPGWWPANADAAFYEDVQVFRPLRHARAQQVRT